MARKPCISLPGVPQHIVQRGNNKQVCFYSESDYLYYLGVLQVALKENQCRLHAYVLMANHVHLLLTPSAHGGISGLMCDVGRKYVRHFNDTHGRTGTLWEGRFKSSMVDSDHYCLACYRYIELNPVSAAVVAGPEGYRWSSYHENALGKESNLVVPHDCWVALGADDVSRRNAYRELFNEKLPAADVEALRFGARKQLPVGTQSFKAEIEAALSIQLGTGKRGRVW